MPDTKKALPVAALKLKFDKSTMFVPKEVKVIEERIHGKVKKGPRPMTLGRDQTIDGRMQEQQDNEEN